MKALSKVCLLIVTLTSCAFLGQASLSSNDKANLAAGGTLLGVGIIKWIDRKLFEFFYNANTPTQFI